MTTNRTSRVTAFDIRLVIALLVGVYGVVLTVLGIGFTTDEEIEKSAGVHINLWAGIGMLVVAAAFGLWALVRPLRVPDQQDEPTGS
jgi:drug/metabolite transporter (DMT)-like permease